MEDARWTRYAALGGVVFVVANVIPAAMTGEPPTPDAPAAEIVEYLKDKGSALQVAQALAGVAAIGLLWWFGSLWRRMTAAEGGHHRLSVTSLAGLVVGGALFLASGAVAAAAAMRVDDLGDSAAGFWVLSGVLLAGAGFGIATHLGATNALALRHNLFARWVAVLGAVAAVGFVVAGVIGSATDSEAAMIVGLISFIAWAVWILAVSATMWRTPEITIAESGTASS